MNHQWHYQNFEPNVGGESYHLMNRFQKLSFYCAPKVTFDVRKLFLYVIFHLVNFILAV